MENVLLRWRSVSERYGVAVALTAAAWLVHFWFGPPYLDSDLGYFAFMVAVFLTSMLTGFGPGIAASFSSAGLTVIPNIVTTGWDRAELAHFLFVSAE